jgi:hypothetical protein
MRVDVEHRLTALEAAPAPSDPRTIWPIFIVGCHRSGTTLLRYLLDAHPALACPPESKFLAALGDVLTYPQAMRGLASLGVAPDRLLSDVRAVVEAYFREYAVRHGKRRWIDKTPNYVRLLPFLDALFAREVLYLLMVRHPFDTAASLAGVAAFNVDEPEDPEIAASVARYGCDRAAWVHHWVDVTDMLVSFGAQTPARTHVVRYEALVTEPERTLADVLGFLGEARSPEVVAALIDNAFGQPHPPGYEDAKIRDSRGIHQHSVGKWTRWPAAEIDRLWPIAADSAARLGYELPGARGRSEAYGVA